MLHWTSRSWAILQTACQISQVSLYLLKLIDIPFTEYVCTSEALQIRTNWGINSDSFKTHYENNLSKLPHQAYLCDWPARDFSEFVLKLDKIFPCLQWLHIPSTKRHEKKDPKGKFSQDINRIIGYVRRKITHILLTKYDPNKLVVHMLLARWLANLPESEIVPEWIPLVESPSVNFVAYSSQSVGKPNTKWLPTC